MIKERGEFVISSVLKLRFVLLCVEVFLRLAWMREVGRGLAFFVGGGYYFCFFLVGVIVWCSSGFCLVRSLRWVSRVLGV